MFIATGLPDIAKLRRSGMNWRLTIPRKQSSLANLDEGLLQKQLDAESPAFYCSTTTQSTSPYCRKKMRPSKTPTIQGLISRFNVNRSALVCAKRKNDVIDKSFCYF
jgi:hypothetical protein